jgi:MFS family permease
VGDTAGGEERFVRGYGGRLLVTVSVGWATIQCGRLVLSPLLPTVRESLAISNTEAGVVFSLLWGLYALLQYPSGRLSDRLSRKTLLVAGGAIGAAGYLVMGLAPTYLAFLGGAAVVGVGVGLYPTAARALLSDLFVRRRGQAFGFHTASGDVGGVAAAGLATLVVAVATWRTAYLPVVALLALVVVAIHLQSRERYVVERTDLALGATARRLLARPGLRRLVLAYVLFAFSWQATTAFLPTFLRASKGLPPAVANAGFAALFMVGAVAKPTAGWLGDRVEKRRVAPASLLLGSAALGAVLVVGSTLAVVVGVVVFAAGLLSFPPVMQAYLMDRLPDESMGGDLGAMRSVYISIGATGPTVAGAIADLSSFAVAFAVLAGCLLASAVLVRSSTRQVDAGED